MSKFDLFLFNYLITFHLVTKCIMAAKGFASPKPYYKNMKLYPLQGIILHTSKISYVKNLILSSLLCQLICNNKTKL